MSERSEERELTALASALRELRPRPDAIPRDVLMYRAGRASAHSWPWLAATLFSTTVALVLGMALWIRPAPPTVYVAVPPAQDYEESASLPAPPPGDDTERGGWSRYVSLQEQVLLHGLDGLPSPPSASDDPPPDAKSLLNSL